MYTYKIFNKSWIFKKTINVDLVKNEVSFSSQINGGLGNLEIEINEKINTSEYQKGDIVKIFLWLELIYSWFIDEIKKSASNYEEVVLSCVGYASRLTNILFKNGSYTGNHNADPKVLVDDAVDYFNTLHNILTKDTESLWSHVNYDFDYTSCFKVIDDMVKVSENFFWYIGADGVVKFKEKPVISKNKFTFQKNVFTLEIEQTEIVNRLFLQHSGGVKEYNDTASQTTYWVFEKKVTDTSLKNVASADLYAASFLAENSLPKDKIVVSVNNDYIYKTYFLHNEMTLNMQEYTMNMEDLAEIKSIINVEPGELCTIRNIDYPLENLLITKKVYTKDKISLYLDSYDSFIWLLKT